MIDIISSVFGSNPETKVLDLGHVRLVDCMPRLVPEGQTCDQAIVQAARVSYGDGTKQVSEDRGLIRYLMRHQHTTPFEMVDLKWHLKMPIFVCRQWIRHRTVSANEISGRYSIMKDEFFIPKITDIRKQSKNNKQGSEGSIDDVDAANFVANVEDICSKAYASYEKAIADGVGKEQARIHLPLNLYTELYWKINAHNLLHFLKLRCDSHAQYEIRVFADAMLDIITPLMPHTVEAWNDYSPYRGAVMFSKLEIEKLKKYIHALEDDAMRAMEGILPPVPALESGNKREDSEWLDKLKNSSIITR